MASTALPWEFLKTKCWPWIWLSSTLVLLRTAPICPYVAFEHAVCAWSDVRCVVVSVKYTPDVKYLVRGQKGK